MEKGEWIMTNLRKFTIVIISMVILYIVLVFGIVEYNQYKKDHTEISIDNYESMLSEDIVCPNSYHLVSKAMEDEIVYRYEYADYLEHCSNEIDRINKTEIINDWKSRNEETRRTIY
jgi:hypothetical protein